ncbi:MAG: hypothetical protein IPN42_02165 [Methylococcaceae bacterium]|nr:hypothetical protein [Methylococcaceae bacterium]
MSTIKNNSKFKGNLRRAIKVALASGLLVSSMSHAALRDHGPISTTTWFPDWYRDNNGLALGQCIFADDLGNGPLCLTGPADSNPAGFAGNVGDEAFFATADIEIPINGGSFLWIGHLEMAYGSASGSPPAIRNAGSVATEIVFSRERIRFDTPVTGDNSCAGHYVIRTPYAVHDFDLEEGGRALFYTDDIQPIMGDYAAALKGHAGPFLVTDLGDGTAVNHQPVNANNTPYVFNPPVGAPRKYIGDNTPNFFWGSTLPVPVGHPHADKGFNNFVEITPPALCDLGSGPGVAMFEDRAGITGLIWDLPIADPTTVTKATYTRKADGTIAGLDVWASAPANHNMVLSATDSDSQNLPSVTMTEETKGGDKTGSYHAHLEFDPSAAGGIPEQVTVTNLSSNPVARDSAAVLDEVIVTKSTFNSDTKVLCIAAHSGDETIGAPELRLDAPAYGAFGPQTPDCNTTNPNDLVLVKNLATDFGADFRIPPEGILVKSDLGGQETSQPTIIRKGVLDALNLQTTDDTFIHVPGINTTVLNLVSDPIAAVPPSLFEKTAGVADAPLPPNYRIVVVSQPEVGTVTASASGGTVTYQAVSNMDASIQTFYYAIQNISDLTVSNVARVDLSVDKVVPPPVGVPDQQAVLRSVAGLGRFIGLTANDVTGLSNTPIDHNSIQIVQAPARGTATPVNGGVNYLPNALGNGSVNNTLDTFTYTVANTAGVRSDPITVQVVLKSTAEAVTFQRVRYNQRWDIRFTSSYAGSTTLAGGLGTLVLAPTAQCVMETNGAGGQLGNIGGSVSPGAGTNAYVNTSATPATVGNNWRIRCTTTSGGSQTRTGTL